ncbi:MAG: hypothetical protein ACPGVD_09520 [Flavobacteriales bacterium]
MKPINLVFLFFSILLLLSCKKDSEVEDVAEEPTEVIVPCSTQINVIDWEGTMRSLYSVHLNSGHAYKQRAPYHISASGSGHDFYIDFMFKPKTGYYKTGGIYSWDYYFRNDKENICWIYATAQGLPWGTYDGANVYIEKLDSGRVSVSFCDVVFNSPSTPNYLEVTAKGNLKCSANNL